MTVGARAGTTTPRLDPKQVIEHGDHEVVVQVAAAGASDDEQTIDRRSASVLPSTSIAGSLANGDRSAHEVLFVRADDSTPTCILQVEDEAGANRFDDRGGASFFPVLGIVEVEMLVGIDVGDRAATHHVRHRVAHSAPA